jgi:hypothetical protein
MVAGNTRRGNPRDANSDGFLREQKPPCEALCKAGRIRTGSDNSFSCKAVKNSRPRLEVQRLKSYLRARSRLSQPRVETRESLELCGNTQPRYMIAIHVFVKTHEEQNPAYRAENKNTRDGCFCFEYKKMNDRRAVEGCSLSGGHRCRSWRTEHAPGRMNECFIYCIRYRKHVNLRYRENRWAP